MIDQEPADLLYGIPAIAAYLRLKSPQIYHLIAKAGLPTFKIGGRVCARKPSITAWLEQREKGQARNADDDDAIGADPVLAKKSPAMADRIGAGDVLLSGAKVL